MSTFPLQGAGRRRGVDVTSRSTVRLCNEHPRRGNAQRQIQGWRRDDTRTSTSTQARALVSHHFAWVWHRTGGTPSTPTVRPCSFERSLSVAHSFGNTAQSVITCGSCTELERQNLTTFFVWCTQSYPRSVGFSSTKFRSRFTLNVGI